VIGPELAKSRHQRHPSAVGIDGIDSLDACDRVGVSSSSGVAVDDLLLREANARAMLIANRWQSSLVAGVRAPMRDEVTQVVGFLAEVPQDD
jgi:hypothetical protein